MKLFECFTFWNVFDRVVFVGVFVILLAFAAGRLGGNWTLWEKCLSRVMKREYEL